ncbi:MAG: ATP-binding cassette domain-containing protein, partial [Planctomycetota bacterium]
MKSGSAAADSPSIAVTELRKSFGPTRAVDGVSFQVTKGEILGFLGPNGAGKSTTLKVITGYLAADSGTVRVAGHNVEEEPLEARSRIGYLPESLPLYWEMRVDEYLCFIAQSRGFKGSQVQERVDEMLALLSLERMRKRLTGSLSKGYRQRVGLAQAMLHDPEILILDEPTNGLDPHQIIEIRSLIVRLAETKAVLFSTHILQEIQAVCSRIMVIREGRLIANDTPENLARSVGDTQWELVVAGTPDLSGERFRDLGFDSLVEEQHHEGCRHYRFAGGSNEPDVAQLANKIAAFGGRLVEVSRPRRTLEQVYLQLTGSNGKEV